MMKVEKRFGCVIDTKYGFEDNAMTAEHKLKIKFTRLEHRSLIEDENEVDSSINSYLGKVPYVYGQ